MKASSESGECASLISTGSFSVFEAVCWPDMGSSVSFCSAALQGRVVVTPASKQLPRPGFSSSQRDFPRKERVYRRRTKETCASQGLAWRQAGRFLARESLAYWRPPDKHRRGGQVKSLLLILLWRQIILSYL